MSRLRQTLMVLPLAILSFLGYVLLSSLLDSSFRLKELRIRGGCEREVFQTVLPFLHERLSRIDESKIGEAISSSPSIKTVGVKKVYPSSLIIEVEERKPSALWVNREGLVTVLDGEGRPFRGLRNENVDDLLLINAPDENSARRLFQLVKGWVREGLLRKEDVMEVVLSNDGITVLYGEDLVEIVLGQRDLDERLRKTLSLYKEARRRGLILKRIDGRSEDREG